MKDQVELHLPAHVFAKVQRFARKERVSLSRAIEILFADPRQSTIQIGAGR